MKKEQKWQFFTEIKNISLLFALGLAYHSSTFSYLTVYFKSLFNLIKNMKIYVSSSAK